MSSRSKSRKTIGPCSSSAQVSTFRRFPMSPLKQKEGRRVWVMEGHGDPCGVCIQMCVHQGHIQGVRCGWNGLKSADKDQEDWGVGVMSWCNSKTLLPCSIFFLKTSAGTHRTSSNPSILQPQHIHPELSHTLKHSTPHSKKALTFKVQKKMWTVL